MQVSSQARFYLSAGAGAVGALVTLIFIPDITQLDLAEGDRRWAALQGGEGHSQYISLWLGVKLMVFPSSKKDSRERFMKTIYVFRNGHP
jgi:hypothetical protein